MKDLNLVPNYIVVEQKKKGIQRRIYLGIILIICFVVVLGVSPVFRYFSLVEEKSRLNAQVSEMEKAVKDAETIKNAISDIDKKDAVANAVESLNDVYVYLLTQVEKKIPTRISALRFNIENNGQTIVFSGAANDEIAVADFLNNIREIEELYDINIKSIINGNSTTPNSAPVKLFELEVKYGKRGAGI